MIKPNFFIVGAAKCGTTAMYEYLKPHPEIFMSPYKEPHHFATDFSGRYVERFRDTEKYLALFSKAQNKKRVGEASVFYIYSREAAVNIQKFNPSARIIIMLRSPVEMVYSLYHQLLYTLDEDIPSFEDALSAEPDRKCGKRIPPTLNTMVEVLFYHEIAQFSGQVQRYFEVFGRDQVQVIIYDDFKDDVGNVYRQTLDFLNVDPYFVPDFRAVNVNKHFRNPAVQTFLLNPPGWIMRAGKKILPIARPVYWWFRKLNAQEAPRIPMSAEVEQQLKQDFLPDIEQLSKMLDRDLTHWCK